MANINLTPFIQALIGLLATLITYRLIPWIKSKMSESQALLLDAAITTAVFAAEQVYGAGNGAEKMDYALNYLRDHGFDVDSRAIEAQVYDLLNHDRKPPAEPEEE
jgi:xanthosine utilization system XapX-like protein